MDDRGQRWRSQAVDNVNTWGNQTAPTLFLALVEEMGEVADELLVHTTLPDDPDDTAEAAWEYITRMRHLGFEAKHFLEQNFEGPAGKPKDASERQQKRQDIGGAHLDSPMDVQDEIDDLAPLVYQLTWEIQSQVDQPDIWVKDPSDRWHRSTTFDGYDHGLACGLTLTAGDNVQDIQMDTSTAPDGYTGHVCGPCLDYWRGRRGDGDA